MLQLLPLYSSVQHRTVRPALVTQCWICRQLWFSRYSYPAYFSILEV